MTDGEMSRLADKARSGDHDAICRLVKQFEPMFFKLAQKIFWPNNAIEDRHAIAVHAFVRAIGTYDPSKTKISTYAFNCAYYALMECQRRFIGRKGQVSRIEVNSAQPFSQFDNPEGFDSALQSESAEVIDRIEAENLLYGIPEREKMVIRMWMDGMLFSEIAKELGVSPGRPVQIFHNGIRRIREAHGIKPPSKLALN